MFKSCANKADKMSVVREATVSIGIENFSRLVMEAGTVDDQWGTSPTSKVKSCILIASALDHNASSYQCFHRPLLPAILAALLTS